MVDAMGSFAPGRELVALGHVGVTAAMPVASVLAPQREADGVSAPAVRAEGQRERPGHARSRSRAYEIVASIV